VLIPVEEQAAGFKALRVRRAPQADQWVWLEYRQPRGYDLDLLAVTSHVFAGVLGHYEAPAETAFQGRSLLIDFNPPATRYHYRDFRDAALVTGRTWSDPFGPLTLRAGQTSSTGMTMAISYDTPCAALSTAAAAHGPGPESGAVTITAPATCEWKAATVADWITLTGPVSGAGNGTVTYRLKPNDTRGARRAGIFIARQEFSVTQKTSALESPPSAASFTPETGSGPTHLLQLTVTDPNGASDIDIVQVTFQGPANRSCLVMLRPPHRLVYLFTDNGVWLDPQTMGTDANLQHSVCGVDVSKVTMSASGNDLKLTLPMVFSPQIGSRVTGKIWVKDTTERQAEFRRGDWQVPSDSCNVALSSGTVEARRPRAAGPDRFTCRPVRAVPGW